MMIVVGLDRLDKEAIDIIVVVYQVITLSSSKSSGPVLGVKYELQGVFHCRRSLVKK